MQLGVARLVHRGIFTLAPGTSLDDGDLLNEETGGEGKRRENVAEGMEELRSGHALSWRGRGREKSKRKCVEKQWPAASAPFFVLMKT